MSINRKTSDQSPGEFEIEVPECLLNKAGFLLNLLARDIKFRVEDKLKPFQISAREFGLLNIINESGPITQKALGQPYCIDRTTMVALVDHLEGLDLVERRVHEKDRRAYALSLTKKGRGILGKCEQIVLAEQNKFLNPLNSREQQELIELLKKLFLSKRQ